MKQTFTTVKRALQEVIGLVLPPTCVVCHVPLSAAEPRGICPECWPKMSWWDKQDPPMPSLSNIDHFSAPFRYEEEAADLVVQLKFNDQPELAPAIARLMKPVLPDYENPVLIPVPMHVDRIRKRQFNQSIMITNALGKLTRFDVNNTGLTRIKNTRPQVGQSAAARKKNMAGAFKACNQVAGRNVIIVDDVMTTGSTVMSCAKELKKAGAKKIAVVTLAYTPL